MSDLRRRHDGDQGHLRERVVGVLGLRGDSVARRAMTIETAPDTVIKFHHLLDLCRAMRLAQKGNLATGERPDPETAMRLETALDFFIAE